MIGRSPYERPDRNEIREREARENAPYIAAAAAMGKPVTFIAEDGCEVTCLPDGRTLFNVADWY
jgi:hypothetical protein